jgi:hypothetical protein
MLSDEIINFIMDLKAAHVTWTYLDCLYGKSNIVDDGVTLLRR